VYLYLFEFITDWVLIGLFLKKLWYGIKLSWKIVNPGQIDEDFLLDELGEDKFKFKVMTKQRELLHEYYMNSVIYQRFALIQTLSLSWIFWKDWHLVLKLSFIFFYYLFYWIYVETRMENLIGEMSRQIRGFYNTQHEFKENTNKRSVGKAKKHLKGNIMNLEMDQIKKIDEFITNKDNELTTYRSNLVKSNSEQLRRNDSEVTPNLTN